MCDQSGEDDVCKWHRRFAMECNNRAWRLSEAPARSATENTEMLDAAHAAALHWSKVGTDIHRARADMLLAHVHALLGHPDIAMQHANASFTNLTSRDSPDWELAFAHAVLAHAASVARNGEIHSRHYAIARQMGRALPDAEEREIFEATFCRVPVPD